MTMPYGGAEQIWRDGSGYNPKKEEIRAWGGWIEGRVGNGPAFPTPDFYTVSDPDQNSADIQAALDAYGTLLIPASYGEVVISDSILIGSGQRLWIDATLKRADGAFDTMVRNKRSILHAAGNVHPGATHPFSPYNVFGPDGSGDPQSWEYEGKVRAQSFDIWFDTTYHYDGVSPIGRVAPGDIIPLDGDWMVVDEDATNTPVMNKNGVKVVPAWDEDFFVGGNFFVMEGNGVNNFDGDFIEWQRFRRNSALFVGVKNYVVMNGSFRNSAGYSIHNQVAHHGRFINLDYRQPAFTAGATNESEGDEAREGIGNLDGINFRSGCHDMLINGMTGQTNDDCVAITTIRPKYTPGYDLADPDNLYPKRMNEVNGVFAFYGPEDYDCSTITVKGHTAKPRGSHHWCRLLASDGRKIKHIHLDASSIAVRQSDLEGNKYGRKQERAVVLIGSPAYGRIPAAHDDISDVYISAPSGSAQAIVEFKWGAKDVYINGLLCGYTSVLDPGEEEGDAVIREQSCVIFSSGNGVIDYYVEEASAAQTTFDAPRFYREPTTINDTVPVITYTRADNKLTVDATGHDRTTSFRATVTILDGSGDPVSGLDAFPATVRVERDELTELPSGNLLIEVDDLDGIPPYEDIPASGRLTIEDHGTYGSLQNWHAERPERYGNGSLKVYVDGVLQTVDVDYTETTGIDPEDEQEIVFTAPMTGGEIVTMERTELPGDYQHICENVTINGGQKGGEEPNVEPDIERRPLSWGHVLRVDSAVTLKDLTVRNFDVDKCETFMTVSTGSRFENLLLENVMIKASGLMPIRITEAADWENSWGTIRNLRLPHRENIWTYYNEDIYGPGVGYSGLAFSARHVFRFDGEQPTVRAETVDHAADIWPLWARDGSVLLFEAGAFPGLPFAVWARKVRDYGEPGARWAAYALEDGTPICNAVMPCEEGPSEQLRIVSGQNFSDAAPPPDGYSIWVIPEHTNTGSFGILVDDMTPIAARPATRPAELPPAGYLRDGVRTKVVWSEAESKWLLHREVEVVENANGAARIYEDGRVSMKIEDLGDAAVSTGPSNGLYRGSLTWTFPFAGCSEAPTVTSISGSIARTGGASVSVTATSADILIHAAASSATVSPVGGIAEGVWF